MKKRIRVLFLAMALLCTTLFTTGVSADAPVDEELTIEHVDVATGQTTQFTVQADESTPSVIPGYAGSVASAGAIEGGIDLNNIIGSDNRYEVKNTDQVPYRFICYTVTNFSDGYKRYGTGFMIGPNKMATSAYNLYDPSHGGKASNIAVAPARNGSSSPYGYVHSTSFEYPTNYATQINSGNSDGAQLYDIACVTLSSNLGSQCGYFNIRSIERSDTYVGKSITVAGYPANASNNTPLYKLNKSAGTVTNGNNANIFYTIDTSYGQSGGPVYIEENGNYFVVGVHNWGDDIMNGARKMTPSILEWFQNR